MADTEIKKGDEVAWNWSGSKPGGEAVEVKAGEVSVTSHRGNEIKKYGDEENPAVHISRPGNDVVKKASELEVQEKGPGHNGESSAKKSEEPKTDGANADGGLKPEQNAKGRSKSKSPQPPATEKKSKSPQPPAAKKEEPKKEESKKDEKPAANGDKKNRGRPKANGAGPSEKKAKTEKPKKRAATETGEPRRSKRNKTG